MRKLLLVVLMSAVCISASTAQTIFSGNAGHKSAIAANPVTQLSLTAQPVKAAKMQIATVAPLALNKDAKIISSVSHGDKKIQVLKNANGTFNKRVVLNKAVQNLHRNSSASVDKSMAANPTLFESFEGWDGVDPDWIPTNWTKESKAGNDASGPENLTWHTTGDEYFVTPTDGNYMGWINFPFPIDDDGNPVETPAQDEWLYSPSFTPVAGDNLIFDINYAAIFMFLNLTTFETDMENPVFTVKALISTDDGATWTTLWDASKDDGYTEDNIWDYLDNEWYTKIISLDSYVGKPVKIAFNYAGKDGDNVGLDRIAVRELNPTALYQRPQGYFMAGLTPDWYSLNADLMLGHAYEPAVWQNYSTESDTYSWEFENPDGSGSTLTSTEENPSLTYPFNFYDIPTLTASINGNSSSYQWGAQANRYFQAGGNMDLGEGTIVGVGNYDISYPFYYYQSSEGNYLYGTNADNSVEGVANYFKKPVHRYVLDGVWAALGVFSFPAGTEFTMVIHRVVDRSVDDDNIIATATCTAEDVIAIPGGGYTMPFTTFKTIDPETQLEVENDYLEIDDAILIEIKGFNNIQGGKIAFCNQQFDSDPVGENNAYVYTPDRILQTYNGATSLLFNLNVTYSFLFADDDQFIAPEGGGEKTFNVTSLYSPSGWWLEDAMPDWLSYDLKFDSTTWDIQFTLKAEPLPANTEYRDAQVKIVTYGADMSILVQQGSLTSISTVAVAADTKVINKNNNFELSYTRGYSVASVYNVAGQKLASYQLPATGRFIIPAGNYPQGVYLFNFTGAKGASTVKVMR